MQHFRKNHIKNRIHKIKPKRNIFLSLWFYLVILFFVIFGAVIYFLFFWQGLQVQKIEISGNEKVKTEELNNFTDEGVNRKIINFGPIKIFSRNILFVDNNNLKKEILNRFPIIEKVSINRKFPQTLIMGVTERKPVGVFCDNTEKCFLVDQNGIAFEGLDIIPQDMFIVRSRLSPNGEVEDSRFGEDAKSEQALGENVVAQNIIDLISKIQKDLKDSFQINVKEALISTPIRLNVQTGENWQVYFGIDQDFDIDLQLQKLNALLNGDITPEIRKTLEYIDLRFKDRAYYK